MFKISDKVVCVNDDWLFKTNHINYPIINEIYVIRDIYISDEIDYKGQAILLVGIFNPYHIVTNKECAFRVWRFRKLEEIQQENKLIKELNAH